VFGSILGVEIENDGLLVFIDQVIFVEDGLRDNVFLCGPVAQVFLTATVTAKREIFALFGIGGIFTNGAVMFHENSPVSKLDSNFSVYRNLN
jgi:hypothetical protein